MKIDFKKPRYVLPLAILPFLCLFFYVYKSSLGREDPTAAREIGLQENVAGVSDEVKNRSLQDKLEAYRNQYSGGDGYTAVGAISEEEKIRGTMPDLYNQREKMMLDSIEQAVKRSTDRKRESTSVHIPRKAAASSGGPSGTDAELAAALNRLRQPAPIAGQRSREEDPMQLFREQMKLIDSMGKANDPEYRAQQKAALKQGTALVESPKERVLPVSRTDVNRSAFNTVMPERQEPMITAIVDEDITGRSGSRLRIRLLDDMMVGSFLVKRGSYLYAQISGFSGQRVSLTINSILQGGQILPVKLEVYDNDGLAGLYVPASAFRDFTKELGGGTAQGINIQQQAENNSQLVMGMLQRMFQSTSSAVSKMLRSNKAKIKYNTIVYLIDPQQLRTKHNNYN